MRYFGLIAARYDVWKVDAFRQLRLDINAKLWQDEESLELISMGMVTPV